MMCIEEEAQSGSCLEGLANPWRTPTSRFEVASGVSHCRHCLCHCQPIAIATAIATAIAACQCHCHYHCQRHCLRRRGQWSLSRITRRMPLPLPLPLPMPCKSIARCECHCHCHCQCHCHCDWLGRGGPILLSRQIEESNLISNRGGQAGEVHLDDRCATAIEVAHGDSHCAIVIAIAIAIAIVGIRCAIASAIATAECFLFFGSSFFIV